MKSALALVLLTALFACSKSDKTASAAGPENTPAQAAVAGPAVPAGLPKVSAPKVNGERALRDTREIVALGPRPLGSPAHKKLEDYLRSKLKSVSLQEDSFTAATPVGPLPARNFIAKFPGTKDGIIVIGGHYDTLYGRTDFVGANDGGASAGLLLELADVLRGRKLDGYSIWLLWFDAEEAIQQWSDSDSLYGSRHLAAQWQKDGTAKKIKAFLLLDMIGDADLNIDRDLNSTGWLLDLVYEAASQLSLQSYFFRRQGAIEDDHLPFAHAGVPVADLIDFEYGYNNVFHHTSNDTLDKLSARSLQIVGDVTLQTAWLVSATR